MRTRVLTNPSNDVIRWKHFPRYWPFVRGIHRQSANAPHKGQWRGALMFYLICDVNKRSRKQPWGWWFQTPSCSLWRHCNGLVLRKTCPCHDVIMYKFCISSLYLIVWSSRNICMKYWYGLHLTITLWCLFLEIWKYSSTFKIPQIKKAKIIQILRCGRQCLVFPIYMMKLFHGNLFAIEYNPYISEGITPVSMGCIVEIHHILCMYMCGH